jgi:hypothetical protein
MVQPGVGEDIVDRACRARLRVGCAKDHPGDSGVDNGAGAHRAGLDRAIQGGPVHTIVVKLLTGLR